jgi:hypothetical protein
MENRHLEESTSSDGWNSFKRQVESVVGPFFFQEKTMNSINYLNILELFTVLQMAHLQPKVFFQQHGAPPYWGLIVRESLNKTSNQMDWEGQTYPLALLLP